MLSCEPARAFASLVTRRLPLRAPPACGVKLTPIEHDCPGSSTGGQCEIALKSPVATMRAIVKGPSPRFVSVAVCWAAVAPTFWLKLSRAGVSCTRAMVAQHDGLRAAHGPQVLRKRQCLPVETGHGLRQTPRQRHGLGSPATRHVAGRIILHDEGAGAGRLVKRTDLA